MKKKYEGMVKDRDQRLAEHLDAVLLEEDSGGQNCPPRCGRCDRFRHWNECHCYGSICENCFALSAAHCVRFSSNPRAIQRGDFELSMKVKEMIAGGAARG